MGVGSPLSHAPCGTDPGSASGETVTVGWGAVVQVLLTRLLRYKKLFLTFT